MDLKYFSLDEFDSPDAKDSGHSMDNDFLLMLDNAREIAKIPFIINSGFRTIEHNSNLPNSKPNSSHIVGKAVDISVRNSRERWIIFNALIKAGFNRIGLGNTFIHVDSDGIDMDGVKDPNVIWTYS